jgi:hypothetical protein
MRHRRRDSTGKLLDERETGNYAGVFSGDLRAHRMSSGAPYRNRSTKWQRLTTEPHGAFPLERLSCVFFAV